MRESVCLKNAIVWEGGHDVVERRDLYIENGRFTILESFSEIWDLSQWLIIPGLEHTLNLSHCPKELGLEIIFKAASKGVTNAVVEDYNYWKKVILESDYPDIASILNDQTMRNVSSVNDDHTVIINPWVSIKQGFQSLMEKGLDMRNAVVKALETKVQKRESSQKLLQLDDNADLIFIRLKDTQSFEKLEKLSDVLLPLLLLENEDGFIKAVMKKGEFVFSKYGFSLESQKAIFEEAFYPQISTIIDAKFDSIEKAIQDIKNGKLVIVVDNEDRENEGDLVVAAQDLTPEMAAFMIRYTSGVLCVPMLGERLESLKLPQMVTQNTDSLKTAYAVSVDHVNTSTGISASDRSMTINALANPKSVSQDFNRPGHVFPLRYHPGGVLSRMGHTEASIDLCKLAGKQPVSVIAEITLDNGTMARRNDLIPWARKWNLSIITISDLIAYKKNRI